MAQGALGAAGVRHCMGWSWAAACGVQGRGILRGFPDSLFICMFMLHKASETEEKLLRVTSS